MLIDVGRLFLYAVIVVVVVLVADSVALILLHLQVDVSTWITVLFLEACVMVFVGAIGFGHGEHDFTVIGWWNRPRLIDILLKPYYSGFWISVGLAGVMLIMLCIYLVQRLI